MRALTPRLAGAVAVALFLFTTACGGDDRSPGDRAVNGVLACEPTDATAIRLHTVAEGFDSPLFVTSPPGDDRLFVVERGGFIWIVDGDRIRELPFLDISDRTLSGGERGLLGLAFHPNYPDDRRFFVNYTANDSPQGRGANVIASFEVTGDRHIADPESELRILEVAQPFSNHNAGSLEFSPQDGFLYIGMGDGGSGGDPQENGENPNTLLGSMLRIDIDSAMPFAVPPGNPFVGGGGAPEVWAYGLRNPYRFSFDRQTSDLWIGDVGQNLYEEIDFQPAASTGGENWGWDIMEGRHCFEPDVGCDMNGKELPISEYDHSGGKCSVTGGYVYRGGCLTAYQGQYFFGDYCTNQVWALPGSGSPNDMPPELTSMLGGVNGLASFGENSAGELFLVSFSDGRVYQVVPETP